MCEKPWMQRQKSECAQYKCVTKRKAYPKKPNKHVKTLPNRTHGKLMKNRHYHANTDTTKNAVLTNQ